MRHITVISIVIVLLAAGCNAEKRAAKKEQKHIDAAKATFAAHPEIFASDCAREFPPKITDSSSSVFKPGMIHPAKAEDTSIDITGYIMAAVQASSEATRQHLIDSFKNHPLVIKVPCPDQTEADPDTVFRVQVKTVENTALVVSLQTQLKSASDSLSGQKQRVSDVTAEKKALNGWIWKLGSLCGLLLLAIIVGIIMKVKKFI